MALSGSCLDCNDTERCNREMLVPLNSYLHETDSAGPWKIVSERSFITKAMVVSAMVVLSVSSVLIPVQGFASPPSPCPSYLCTQTRTGHFHTCLDMYLQPNGEPSHNGPWVGQVFFNTERSRKNSLFHNSRRKRIFVPTSHGKKQSMLKYSRSILTSTDTLPSFSTAHGLLSPETVMRMDSMTRGSRSEPLEYFFQHYRRNGPMACLPFLTDMNVLPYLTEAMRDITSD